MGLFSSKYVHHVGTAIQRVIDPKDIVNPLSVAVTEATLTKVDLVDNILETALNSLPTKATVYYNFVAAKYPTKLPSGRTLVDTRFYDAAAPILDSLYPDCSIQYVRFGSMNAFHEAWFLLSTAHGFDSVTQRIAPASNTDADFIAEYMILEVPHSMKDTVSPWEIDSWMKTVPQGSTGHTISNLQIVPRFTTKGIQYKNISTPKAVVYGLMVPKKKPIETETSGAYVPEYVPYEIPLSLFKDGYQYYHAVVTNTNSDGDTVTTFAIYRYLSGGFPTLDAVAITDSGATPLGVYFPNIYYRLDKQPANDPAYPIFSRRIGLDYEKSKAGINENEGIADVETAAFNMGVPANTTNSVEAGYIYDYFDLVHKKNASSVLSLTEYQSDWTDTYKPPSLSEAKSAILINDDKMKTALTYERITRTFHKGQLHPVGDASAGTGTEDRYYQTVDFEGAPTTSTKQIKYYYYRKQVSQDIWREIRVYDLSMVYTIGGEYLSTVGDDIGNEEICLIPIDKTIIEKYPFSKKNELLNRSFHFVFNSHVIQKLKWYQQEWFADLLNIIAIAIFIYTGFDFLSGLQAALTVSVTAAIQFVAMGMLKAVLYGLAFKVFVKVVGEEVALLMAIVAAAYGMFEGSVFGLSPAQLLELASGIFKGITGVLQDKFQDLTDEVNSWTSLKTAQEKELEDANNLLEVKFNPIGTIINGELPGQFLHRNLVFGVSGFTSINDVSGFVDQSLYLPTTG